MKFAAVLALAGLAVNSVSASSVPGAAISINCVTNHQGTDTVPEEALGEVVGEGVETAICDTGTSACARRRTLNEQGERDLAKITITDEGVVMRDLGGGAFLVYKSVYYVEKFGEDGVECSAYGLGGGLCNQVILTYEAYVEPNGGVHEDNVDELTLAGIPDEWKEEAREYLRKHVLAMYDGKTFVDVKVDDHIFISTFGDPHFKTFNGGWFDFMGACDLKMIHAPVFDGEDKPLDVDIRTKIRYDYSYVEAAAIKLGDDVLEVGSYGEYYVNGVSGAKMPATLGDYTVTRVAPSDKVTIFTIELGETGEKIILKNFKDMVAVMFDGVSGSRLAGSVGMVGTKDKGGKMIGRDGETEVEDPNLFAAEWQIRDTEPMLFNSESGPQFPEQCQLPDPTAAKGRRLGESIALSAAEKACAKWAKENYDACVHDVMAVGDLEFAAAGAF